MGKYIAKRLTLMIVSLFAISLLSFIVIELPPGDFLTSVIDGQVTLFQNPQHNARLVEGLALAGARSDRSSDR